VTIAFYAGLPQIYSFTSNIIDKPEQMSGLFLFFTLNCFFPLFRPFVPGSHSVFANQLQHLSITVLPLLAAANSDDGNAAREVTFLPVPLTAGVNPAPAAIYLHRHDADQSDITARSRWQ